MPRPEPASRLIDATLFASIGTLFCCALPALLVALGMGAVVAFGVANIPGFVWLSEHKAFIFLVAGVLLIAAGAAQWRARSLPCPVNSPQAAACGTLRRRSWIVYWVSFVVYVCGLLFAYILPRLM